MDSHVNKTHGAAMSEAEIVIVYYLAAMIIGYSIVAALLYRYNLLKFSKSGFWIFVASAIYFIIHPLVSLVSRETKLYSYAIAGTEGAPRVLHISIIVFLGMAVFFTVYLWGSRKWVGFSFREVRAETSKIYYIILILFYCIGIYAVFAYRIPQGIDRYSTIGLTRGGEFTGDITGYQYAAHLLCIYPLAALMINSKTKWVAYLLLAIYVSARAFDAWDRASIVYSVLVVLICQELRFSKRTFVDNLFGKTIVSKWLSGRIVGLLIVFAVIILLFSRGHRSIDEAEMSNDNVKKSTWQVFTSTDSAMLANLYLRSYANDKLGYNYGTPLVAKAIFGPLPRRYFPWKDKAANSISINPDYENVHGADYLTGHKTTVIGDLYSFGGYYAIIFGMILMALILLRLDKYLLTTESFNGRVLGVTYLSTIWMVFASSLTWGLSVILLIGAPAYTWITIKSLKKAAKRI